MNKKELKYFEQLILDKRNGILKQLGRLEETSLRSTVRDSTGDLSSISYHMPDQGTDAMEREKAFLFASREEAYLVHLEAALDRIKDGSFGTCQACEGEIGKARLEAVPNATMCITCKSKRRQPTR